MNSKVFTDITAYLDSWRRARQYQVCTRWPRLYSVLNYNEVSDSLLMNIDSFTYEIWDEGSQVDMLMTHKTVGNHCISLKFSQFDHYLFYYFPIINKDQGGKKKVEFNHLTLNLTLFINDLLTPRCFCCCVTCRWCKLARHLLNDWLFDCHS